MWTRAYLNRGSSFIGVYVVLVSIFSLFKRLSVSISICFLLALSERSSKSEESSFSLAVE